MFNRKDTFSGPTELPDELIDTATVTVRKDDDDTKFINQYQVVKQLGKGSFGKVKLVKHTETGELFAMKVFSKAILKKKRMGAKNIMSDVIHEIGIQKKLDHTHCVKLYEVLDSVDQHKMFLRIEYAEGGECMPTDEPTEPHPESTARKYFTDLINGLEYMHSLDIIHRDIKPENLLISSSGQIKIADFGSAMVLEGGTDVINKSAGTPAFTSPEACVEGDYSGKAADVWAAGVTLYIFAHGKVPFMSPTLVQIFQMIKDDEVEFSASLPPTLRDLLEKLLDKDFTKRITIAEIKRHPWMMAAEP